MGSCLDLESILNRRGVRTRACRVETLLDAGSRLLGFGQCERKAARGVSTRHARGGARQWRLTPIHLFYPLNEFYEQAGLPLPSVAEVEARDVPEPYRSLLVHDRDM